MLYTIICPIISFKNFNAADGVWGSEWVGLKYFEQFFTGVYFTRILGNTLIISLYSILFVFPAPIILALLMNELQKEHFKRMVQSVTYMPHFVSIVVICGIITDFCSNKGLFNSLIEFFGGTRQNLLMKPDLFRPIYILSDIWQGVGWGSIVYLAALAGIDSELYEAARIDGAGRWRQLLNITIPGILPTITIMLILRIGQIMNVGFEKVMLLYNATTYSVADVISTYVYRKGIIEANFSFSAAVGLFNSVVNTVLIVSANCFSRRLGENSLW